MHIFPAKTSERKSRVLDNIMSVKREDKSVTVLINKKIKKGGILEELFP